MSRSTASSRERSACTSSRASTSCSASAGTSPADDAASFSNSVIRRFVCAASRPPFRIAAFPDLRHSEAICTSASGRDSNTAAMTPKGHVMRLSVNSSSSSVAMRATPSGSGRAATARTPSAICAILPPVSSRRLSSGSDISPLATSGSASATSSGVRFEDSPRVFVNHVRRSGQGAIPHLIAQGRESKSGTPRRPAYGVDIAQDESPSSNLSDRLWIIGRREMTGKRIILYSSSIPHDAARRSR